MVLKGSGAMNPTLAYKIKMLPESPGCYIMKSRGEIIYVGKAVNLKNRVRQYFHGSHTPKVAAMVSRVDDFDLMLCQTNFEALTLECNLIKKHRPFYNILLKDDKHYPYLRIDLGEPFPRLTLARNMDEQRAGVKYFGPYIGATAVRQVMDEVRRFFPLRTCNLSFPVKSPRRPCVHHQIGQCLAPCAGGVSEEAYRAILARVIDFLNGDSRELLSELTREMNVASARMEYEQAAVLRDKIADIRQLMEEQHAIQTRDVEQDVLYIAQVERHGKNGNVGKAFMGGFHIRGGAMASSVGHDNHNIIVMGDSFEDMALAVNKKELNRVAHEMGTEIAIPFMFLSFICLAAIPAYAITDCGFIDVVQQKVIDPILEVVE